MIAPAQLRSARGYLNLSRNEVAEQTGVGVQTLADIETGKTESPRTSTLHTLKRFYESHDLQFTDDGGLRPSKTLIRQYQGADGFREFMDDVYETAKAKGGEICLHNANPSNWLKWLGAEWNTFHTQRMQTIERSMNFKITAGHNDYNMIGKHAEYRWLPEDMWNEQSFYAYGDRIALLHFEDTDVNILVMHSKEFADGFRSLFNVAWDNISIVPPKKDGK